MEGLSFCCPKRRTELNNRKNKNNEICLVDFFMKILFGGNRLSEEQYTNYY